MIYIHLIILSKKKKEALIVENSFHLRRHTTYTLPALKHTGMTRQIGLQTLKV
jgi:hypothetical protein